VGRTYTIVWTPSGGGAITLCDLSQGWWPVFEQWPAQGEEQMDRLAFGPSVFRYMRGNVSGDAVFTVSHSHPSFDDGAAWFQYVARLQASSALAGDGKLVVTIGSTIWSYSGATFRRVDPVKMNGCEWTLRYNFGVTQLDALDSDNGAPSPGPATDPH
jgi:hypothetical protein